MPIAATDLKFYGSATMPDSDATNQIGGAIATTKKVVFTDINPAGAAEVISDNAGDTTQTVTVYYRNSAGSLLSEAKSLNGTTEVDFTETDFERFVKATLSATATGTVTIRKNGDAGDLLVFEPGITEIRRPFYNAEVPASGSRTYYEKVFIKNDHGSLTLTSAVVSEQADPTSKVTFTLETTIDGTGDNGASNNRQVAPSTGVGTFSSSDQSVTGDELASGEAIGVWLALLLTAGDGPQDSSYTLRLAGNTT